MIEAIKEHHMVLGTDDSRTKEFSDVVHNMSAWLHHGLITKEIFFYVHDALRENASTENFLSVVGYCDEREEKNEYTIRVIEFPVKADGSIRTVVSEDERFFLLTEEEYEKIKVAQVGKVAFDVVENNGFKTH